MRCWFFSVLLAKEGHQVTGIDLTPDMIKMHVFLHQRKNRLRILVMDAENPEFPEGTFDVIISRNLTWTLPHVSHAYGEWLRVLKKGGVLLNFDANYGLTDFSNVADLPENHAHNILGDDMMRECEEIKRQLPDQFLQPSGVGSGNLRFYGSKRFQSGSGYQQQDLSGKR